MRCSLLVCLSACAFSGGGAEDASVQRDAIVCPDASISDAGSLDAEAGVLDAGPIDGVWVGTGSVAFASLTADQVVALHPGPQGGGRFSGFHVWFGARTVGFDPEMMMVTFTLRAIDGTDLAVLGWQTRFRPSMEVTGAHEIWGASPRISDCCLARNAPLVMRVDVMDRAGKTASDEISVVGGPACEDFSGDVCP